MEGAIGEKYELELMPIAIGGKKLELYKVARWDDFVNNLAREGEEYIHKFPFWVKIWEAEIVLADHLMQVSFEKEQEILEIGAGMGVTGLFLATRGHKVTITDYEEDALALLRLNAEHNGLHNVAVRRLDWNSPDLSGKYDIICGSELIYNETFIEPIINLFRAYLRPEGLIFLAHDLDRKCLMQFIGMVPGRFEIENVVKTMKGKKELYKVAIHLLHLKH
jgi:predicted nicotinamide N-methyase